MGIEEIKDAVKNLPEEKVAKLKKELYLGSKTKGVLDAIQERVVSRKLLVFGASTCLFIFSLIWTLNFELDNSKSLSEISISKPKNIPKE